MQGAFGVGYVLALQRCLSAFQRESNAPRLAATVRVNGRLHWTSSDAEQGLISQRDISRLQHHQDTHRYLRFTPLRDPIVGPDRSGWEMASRSSLGRRHHARSSAPSHERTGRLRASAGISQRGTSAARRTVVEAAVSDAVLSRGPLFAPGDGWAYSNVGYMLLLEVLGTSRVWASRRPFRISWSRPWRCSVSSWSSGSGIGPAAFRVRS